MKRIALMLACLSAIAVLGGSSCQGTMGPPGGPPGGGPPNNSSLVIKSVAADAVKDQLLISGEFGDQPGTVMIGGVTLNVVSWGTPGPVQQIVCDLPREASGNVQVQVGTEFSNVAQLSKWELTLVSKTDIPAMSANSTGAHHITITSKFIVRACLNNLLGATGNFGVFASVSRASTGDFDASGTITNQATQSVPQQSFTLSKQLPQTFLIVYPGDSIDPDADRFSARNFVCYATRGSGGGIKLLFSIAGFYHVTENLGGNITEGEHATGYATNTYFDTSMPVLFPFEGGGFTIASGKVTAKNDPNSTLEWNSAAPSSPPVD